jgi:hypothetical protein
MSCALAGDNKASYKHNQGGKYGDIHQRSRPTFGCQTMQQENRKHIEQ